MRIQIKKTMKKIIPIQACRDKAQFLKMAYPHCLKPFKWDF